MKRNWMHKELAKGRWLQLSLLEQLANIGMDVERVIASRKKGDMQRSRFAFDRALDLIDLTIADAKNRKRLKEICRMREMLVDYFVYDNEYRSTDKQWHDYFYAFNYAVAIAKGR